MSKVVDLGKESGKVSPTDGTTPIFGNLQRKSGMERNRIGISVCNVCLCQICPPHSAVERHRVGIGDG